MENAISFICLIFFLHTSLMGVSISDQVVLVCDFNWMQSISWRTSASRGWQLRETRKVILMFSCDNISALWKRATIINWKFPFFGSRDQNLIKKRLHSNWLMVAFTPTVHSDYKELLSFGNSFHLKRLQQTLMFQITFQAIVPKHWSPFLRLLISIDNLIVNAHVIADADNNWILENLYHYSS